MKTTHLWRYIYCLSFLTVTCTFGQEERNLQESERPQIETKEGKNSILSLSYVEEVPNHTDPSKIAGKLYYYKDNKGRTIVSTDPNLVGKQIDSRPSSSGNRKSQSRPTNPNFQSNTKKVEVNSESDARSKTKSTKKIKGFEDFKIPGKSNSNSNPFENLIKPNRSNENNPVKQIESFKERFKSKTDDIKKKEEQIKGIDKEKRDLESRIRSLQKSSRSLSSNSWDLKLSASRNSGGRKKSRPAPFQCPNGHSYSQCNHQELKRLHQKAVDATIRYNASIDRSRSFSESLNKQASVLDQRRFSVDLKMGGLKAELSSLEETKAQLLLEKADLSDELAKLTPLMRKVISKAEAIQKSRPIRSYDINDQ